MLQAFAAHVAAHMPSEAAAQDTDLRWPEAWGTAGEFTQLSPFVDVLADQLPAVRTGAAQKEVRLADQPPPNVYDDLFRAVDDDARLGALSFRRLHGVSMLKVPTPADEFGEPEVSVEEHGAAADHIRFPGPAAGWMRQVEVLMLLILKGFVVRIRFRDTVPMMQCVVYVRIVTQLWLQVGRFRDAEMEPPRGLEEFCSSVSCVVPQEDLPATQAVQEEEGEEEEEEVDAADPGTSRPVPPASEDTRTEVDSEDAAANNEAASYEVEQAAAAAAASGGPGDRDSGRAARATRSSRRRRAAPPTQKAPTPQEVNTQADQAVDAPPPAAEQIDDMQPATAPRTKRKRAAMAVQQVGSARSTRSARRR